MKDLLVKIDKKGKDWVELDVYTKIGKKTFSLKTLRIVYNEGKVDLNWGSIGHMGFLCEHCKKAELENIANGHMSFHEEEGGLCSMCANTEEIFRKYEDRF